MTIRKYKASSIVMNYFHIDLLSQFITLFTSLQKKTPQPWAHFCKELLLSWSTQRSFVKSWDCWTRGSVFSFFCDGHKFPRLKFYFDSHFVSLEYSSLTFIYCLQMLSVIEPDGAENFSIGQIIQVRELKVPISDHRRTKKTWYNYNADRAFLDKLFLIKFLWNYTISSPALL